MQICKYCGIEYKYDNRYKDDVCSNCAKKLLILRRFAKARDDLRQMYGMMRLTKGSEYIGCD